MHTPQTLQEWTESGWEHIDYSWLSPAEERFLQKAAYFTFFLDGKTVAESTRSPLARLAAGLYGRIVRQEGTDFLLDIVEHKDASEKIRQIKEINSGTFCFDNRLLFETIDQIGCDNVQGEYYLTDAVRILHGKGHRVSVVVAANPDEVLGVNSAEQLELLAGKFAG